MFIIGLYHKVLIPLPHKIQICTYGQNQINHIKGFRTLGVGNGFSTGRQPLLSDALSCRTAQIDWTFQQGHRFADGDVTCIMQGIRDVEKYKEAGITWWDYCGHTLVNSYPTYFEKLPPLISKINKEKRNSKNYVLFLGETGVESNQAPCLSLVQFQIDDGELVVSAYQRSSDASLGLPADIYHLYLMTRQIELPLKSITLDLGNVHIYENNIDKTKELLSGGENIKFELNA